MGPPPGRRLLRVAHALLPTGLAWDVVVELEDGAIVEVRPGRSSDPPAERGVLVPGLVNAHLHLELGWAAGRVPGGEGLPSWVGRLMATPRPDGWDPDPQPLVAAGTAVVCDVSNRGDTAPVLARAGLAGVVQHERLGFGREPFAPAEVRYERAIVVRDSPHAVYSTSPDRIRAFAGPAARIPPSGSIPPGEGVGGLESSGLGPGPADRDPTERGPDRGPADRGPADRGTAEAPPRPATLHPNPLPPGEGVGGPDPRPGRAGGLVSPGRRVPASIHLAEDPAEAAFTLRGEGPFAELLDRLGRDWRWWRPPGVTPAAYLDELGVLGPGLLVVHGVWLTEEDRRRLAARGSLLCLCPRSNLHVGGRLPDVPALLADGVRLCLGTDSLGSSPDLDVLGEVPVLAAAFPEVPLETWLLLATRGGADALGFPRYGRIAPGAAGGLVLLEVDDPRALAEAAPPRRWEVKP